jgi:hypothetical protein
MPLDVTERELYHIFNRHSGFEDAMLIHKVIHTSLQLQIVTLSSGFRSSCCFRALLNQGRCRSRSLANAGIPSGHPAAPAGHDIDHNHDLHNHSNAPHLKPTLPPHHMHQAAGSDKHFRVEFAKSNSKPPKHARVWYSSSPLIISPLLCFETRSRRYTAAPLADPYASAGMKRPALDASAYAQYTPPPPALCFCNNLNMYAASYAQQFQGYAQPAASALVPLSLKYKAIFGFNFLAPIGTRSRIGRIIRQLLVMLVLLLDTTGSSSSSSSSSIPCTRVLQLLVLIDRSLIQFLLQFAQVFCSVF